MLTAMLFKNVINVNIFIGTCQWATKGAALYALEKGFIQPQVCNFIKNKALAQVLSCKFCEISKNAFSYRRPPVIASDKSSRS